MFETHASLTTFGIRGWYILNINKNTTYNNSDLYYHETITFIVQWIAIIFLNNTQKYLAEIIKKKPTKNIFYYIVIIILQRSLWAGRMQILFQRWNGAESWPTAQGICVSWARCQDRWRKFSYSVSDLHSGDK
jgi:hypothetical protein